MDETQTSPLSWRTLRLLVLGALAIKFALLVLIQPFMDETYYWMWGQHPALSYFDHPPLVAWVNGLSATLFGWNRFALRLPVLLTTLGDIGMLYLFARRLGGESWRESFWLTALLFLVTPIFFLLTTLALPDHLMILGLLAALYCFHGVLVAHDSGASATRLIYLGAIALGFALLSKFYAGLAAIGLIVFLVASARYRGLFRNPHVWIAILVVAIMQAPVLIWNMQNDFAGFGFVTGGRQRLGNLLSFRGVIGYLLGIVLVLSPFLLLAAWRFLTDRRGGPDGIARNVSWVSTLAFLVASVFTNILVHWNLVAYVAALPFLGRYLRSRVALIGHLIFSGLFIAVIGINYGAFPLLALAGPVDQTSVWSYGWDEVAARVEVAREGYAPGFVAGTSYEIASALGFAMGDRDVTSLAGRREAFDDFFDASAHSGETAIIVADGWRGIGSIKRHFTELTLIDTVEIKRFGTPITKRQIYVGTAFVP